MFRVGDEAADETATRAAMGVMGVAVNEESPTVP